MRDCGVSREGRRAGDWEIFGLRSLICLFGLCFCGQTHAVCSDGRLTTGEGANGNCSEDPDASEEAQTEAVEMIVERQASPVAETCDDARGESGDNERGNGNPVAAERNSHRQEAGDEQRKVSREPSREREDGGEKDSVDKDAEVLESLKPRTDAVKQKLVQDTKGFGVFRLEMLHANICRVLQKGHGESCTSRLACLEAFVAEESNLS